jgi:hypothetical protein
MKLKHRFYLALFIVVWGILCYFFIVPFYTLMFKKLIVALLFNGIIGIVVSGIVGQIIEDNGTPLYSLIIGVIFCGTLFPLLGMILVVAVIIYHIVVLIIKGIQAFEAFLDKLEDKYEK